MLGDQQQSFEGLDFEHNFDSFNNDSIFNMISYHKDINFQIDIQDSIEYQKNHKKNQIVLESNGKTYFIDNNIVIFSEFLKQHRYGIDLPSRFQQNNRGKQQKIQSNRQEQKQLHVIIPQSIKLTENLINIIQKFMQISQNNPQNIYFNEISFTAMKTDLKNCSQSVKIFIEQYLTQIQKEQIKLLIQICQFLRIHSLLEVIYFNLGMRYRTTFSDKQTKEKLKKLNVQQSLSRQQTHKLKQKYYGFFQQLALNIDTIQEEKIQNAKRRRQQLIKKHQQQERINEEILSRQVIPGNIVINNQTNS